MHFNVSCRCGLYKFLLLSVIIHVVCWQVLAQFMDLTSRDIQEMQAVT